jgi:hypothetical protein
MQDKKFTVYTPNRVGLSILIAAGICAGLAPLLLHKSAAFLLLPVFVWSAAAAWWTGRTFTSRATVRPNIWEWLLAGWNAVGIGASASLVAFIWYGMAYALIWAFVLAANAIGWAIAPSPSTGATYVAAVMLAIIGLSGPVLAAKQIPVKLYPGIAGIRSTYYSLADRPWMLALVASIVAAGCILGLTVFGLDLRGFWFALLLTLTLAGTSSPLLEPGETRGPSESGNTVLRAVARLYAAAGYEVVERPRTDDPELDPLVATVDLLASAGDRAYAIQTVVIDSPQTEVEESTVFDVRAGAKGLQRALRGPNAGDVRVEPYLLVVGGRLGEHMQDLCRDVGVSLVHLADTESLREAVVATDKHRLRAMALRLLQVPLAESELEAQ